MRMKILKPSAAIVWASLFFTILPLAYWAALRLVSDNETLAVDEVRALLGGVRLLAAPALSLCAVLDCQPEFWIPHAAPSAMSSILATFLISNFVGWIVLLTGVALTAHWLRMGLSRRLRAP